MIVSCDLSCNLNVCFQGSDVKRGGGETIDFAACGRSPASLATGVPCAISLRRLETEIVPGPILRQLFLALLCLLFASGCGAAIQRNGTDQLLLSDSVDRAIDQLDLSPLAGRKVYLDTTYMQTFKGANVFINSDYIISACGRN